VLPELDVATSMVMPHAQLPWCPLTQGGYGWGLYLPEWRMTPLCLQPQEPQLPLGITKCCVLCSTGQVS